MKRRTRVSPPARSAPAVVGRERRWSAAAERERDEQGGGGGAADPAVCHGATGAQRDQARLRALRMARARRLALALAASDPTGTR